MWRDTLNRDGTAGTSGHTVTCTHTNKSADGDKSYVHTWGVCASSCDLHWILSIVVLSETSPLNSAWGHNIFYIVLAPMVTSWRLSWGWGACCHVSMTGDSINSIKSSQVQFLFYRKPKKPPERPFLYFCFHQGREARQKLSSDDPTVEKETAHRTHECS